MARYYPAIVEADSDGYSVFFPDVPGCASGGATLQEAAQNAEEALQAHLDLSEHHGDPLPEPSDLDTAPVDPDIRVVARLLVRAETTKAKPVRVNIMMPGDLLAAVDRYAARLGYTRSGLLAQAVRDKLRRENDAGAR
jgi:predicted RNase H-like HicB family nuclease